MDRFFFKLKVPYPSERQFEQILDRTTDRALPKPEPIFERETLLEMGRLAREVPVAPSLRTRAVQLVMATHPETAHASAEVKRYVRYGASPRAGQACILAAKIRALLDGRYHVATEDLLRRVMLSFEAQADGIDADDLIGRVLAARRDAWDQEA